MCPRKYHGGVVNENLALVDWTLEDFIKIFNRELLNQIRLVYFCGNFGDPVMNNDLIDMCQYIKDNAPNIELRIHTNGGARTSAWWKKLYRTLPENHVLFFALDGLEDTHHLYRIGTTYENVVKNAKTFIDEGGIAEWVFIKFKHNEHQVDEAEIRSKNLGFKRFTVKNTTRFVADKKYNVVDENNNTLYYLEPPTDNKVVFVNNDTIKNHDKILLGSEINCYVLEAKEIYIDAHKNVFPCCFLASTPYHYQPKNPPINELENHIRRFHNTLLEQYYNLVNSLGGIEKLSALNYSIKEIIDREEWQTVWEEYWTTKKLYTCARVCGKTSQNFSKPKDQFIKRVSNAN
jgi:hypothetical protein